MKIKIFELGPLGVNAYLMFPENSDGAILVDAPHESAQVIPDFLKSHGRKLTAILITHGHFDHVWDIAALAKETGAKIYASAKNRKLIESAESHAKYAVMEDFSPAKISKTVSDGEELSIDGVKIVCFDAPGHCDGSLIYYLPDESVAFVGDVIFEGSVGRTDLDGGSFEILEKSIKTKLYSLPETTSLMPGHGSHTTVFQEMASNPYVRG